MLYKGLGNFLSLGEIKRALPLEIPTLKMLTLRIENFKYWRADENSAEADVSFLPALQRRKLSGMERTVAHLAHLLCADKGNFTSVFASRFGEFNRIVKLLKIFNREGEVSPNGFSSSVHNSAIGAQSVLLKNKGNYTAISAMEDTLEMGLIEAFTISERVFFVFVDSSFVPPFERNSPEASEGFAFFAEPSEASSFSATLTCGKFSDIPLGASALNAAFESKKNICGKYIEIDFKC